MASINKDHKKNRNSKSKRGARHTPRASAARPRKGSTYTVVSIQKNDVYHNGVFPTYKMARKVALNVDRYLTRAERVKGFHTEIWTNYDEDTGDIQTVHVISPRRI